MLKKGLSFLILVLVLVGFFYGIMLTVERRNPHKQLKKIEENVFSKLQRQMAEAENVFTYGKTININGK